MRRVLWTIVLVCGCTQQPISPVAAVEPRARTEIAEYSLPAFGGRLLGVDGGEWGGSLMFEDAQGEKVLLLKENVRGIVRNDVGVFVFTGLTHMHVNEGFIVQVFRDKRIRTILLGSLPGAPTQVRQRADGVTFFLVNTGRSSPGGKQVFACYALTGNQVTHAQACSPPGSDPH